MRGRFASSHSSSAPNSSAAGWNAAMMIYSGPSAPSAPTSRDLAKMWVMVVIIVCGVAAGLQASWVCPDIRDVSCSCYNPHTLRCTGNQSALELIASTLRNLPSAHMVSLLDCSIQGLVHIKEPILKGVSLHGLVISSRVLISVAENAFDGLRYPLEALGFPNNQLAYVPILAISRLTQLTRLDLSHNRLPTLGSHSFQKLYNLQFLDLSWNRLTNISSSAFSDLSRLKTLRLQSNYLNSGVVSRMRGLPNLQNLDLNNNRLTGPLGPGTLPSLPKLRTLNIAHNQISSILTNAFSGFDMLESLNAENNMIDVLEDHGFKSLTKLETLNLAHNRIIAFSESSFAHLTNLTSLDLSGNFLRALSLDLLTPLKNLRELRLDGNDISMISADAIKGATHLRTLTLTDNPLNCDCSLIGYAEWLNRTNVEQKSHGNAVCAIPPSLENAFVQDLPVDQLVCDQGDSLAGTGSMPVSGSGVMLQGFDYNGTHVSLLWMVDSHAPYRCGELFIYEELGAHEVLLETESLTCNSSSTDNPRLLSITHNVSRLEKGHNYRYCLTMVELRQKVKYDFQNSLALGCSEIMALKVVSPPRIADIQAVNSALAFLEVYIESWPPSSLCSGVIVVYVDSKIENRTPFLCNVSKYNITELPTYGPYKVCVIIDEHGSRCVSVVGQHILPDPYTPFFTLLFLVIFLVGLLIAVMAYEYCKKRGQQPKLQEQCFLATHPEENQSTGYMKLHATTKL